MKWKARTKALAVFTGLAGITGLVLFGAPQSARESLSGDTPARTEHASAPDRGLDTFPRESAASSRTPGESRLPTEQRVHTPASDEPRVLFASALDYLQDYWGEQWPALRAELEERAPGRLTRYEEMALTEDLVPPPLSELSGQIIELFLREFDREARQYFLAWRADAEAWPDVIDVAFVTEKLGRLESEVDGDIVQGVQQVADHHRAGLVDARRRFLGAARDAVEREAKAGAFVAWPLILVGPGRDPRTGGPPRHPGEPGSDVMLAMNYRGLWHLMLHVYSAEYPYVHELRLELETLGKARLREAKAVVRK